MMKMTIMMDDVCELNDKAVHLMQEAHYDEAAHVLRDALEHLRSDLANDMTAASRTSDCSITIDSNLVIEHVQLMDRVESEKHQHDAFFFCTEAFVCHSTSRSLAAVPWKFENSVSAVIFYNLALAVHLRSLICLPNQKKVRCALRLYDMALKVLPSRLEASDHLLPLTLACVNNKGHICSIFYERHALNQCLDSMSSLLEVCNNENWTVDADRELCCEFQLNVLLFCRIGQVQSAPAA